jgi:hypothetical protein
METLMFMIVILPILAGLIIISYFSNSVTESGETRVKMKEIKNNINHFLFAYVNWFAGNSSPE